MVRDELNDSIETNFDDSDIVCSHLTLCFNYRFWDPVDCIGGNVCFGSYYKHCYGLRNGNRSQTTFQTPSQIKVKRSMGLI
ncbi:hypothetical protein HOC80_05295 [archaeon]|jgi:hypothetical protein|nr:hypothetical protein [archaeon]MBT4417487.1 hypothetical protein [archaeon]